MELRCPTATDEEYGTGSGLRRNEGNTPVPALEYQHPSSWHDALQLAVAVPVLQRQRSAICHKHRICSGKRVIHLSRNAGTASQDLFARFRCSHLLHMVEGN